MELESRTKTKIVTRDHIDKSFMFKNVPGYKNRNNKGKNEIRKEIVFQNPTSMVTKGEAWQRSDSLSSLAKPAHEARSVGILPLGQSGLFGFIFFLH